MSKGQPVKGFDYARGKLLDRPVAEWRTEMRERIAKQQCYRRCESDSKGPVTYLHEKKGGRIVLEIYGSVAL
jgi:hypothetical protein